MDHLWETFIFILLGLVFVLGSLFNWRILMNPGKLLNRLMGQKVGRLVYLAAGIIFLLVGIGLITGWVNL